MFTSRDFSLVRASAVFAFLLKRLSSSGTFEDSTVLIARAAPTVLTPGKKSRNRTSGSQCPVTRRIRSWQETVVQALLGVLWGFLAGSATGIHGS